MAFIGLDRAIVDHWIYQDAEYFKVWFEMLYRARFSHEPEKKLIEGKLVTIGYGQFIFGRVSWSERLNISEQRLRTLMKKLIEDEMIALIQNYNKFSLYSVKNYAKFNQQSNQQKIQQYQGFEGDANQHSNQQLTISQPADNHQLTTQEQGSNKDNKDNKVNKTVRFAPPSLDDVQAYCTERNKGVDATRWYNHYTSNGWKVGKNKMQDWKAAVRTWEQNARGGRNNEITRGRTENLNSGIDFGF